MVNIFSRFSSLVKDDAILLERSHPQTHAQMLQVKMRNLNYFQRKKFKFKKKINQTITAANKEENKQDKNN